MIQTGTPDRRAHQARSPGHLPLQFLEATGIPIFTSSSPMAASAGCPVPTGVGVPEDDRAFALRWARSCARNPVALERMRSDPAIEQVTYRSDQADGPTAGTATGDPLEFLARLVTHIPDPGPVMQRNYGW